MVTRIRVSAKSVYEPSSRTDGRRILVMRLWPRGIKKDGISRWLRELAPEYPLLKGFKSGRIAWPEFARRYRAGLKKPAAREQLEELSGAIHRGRTTLLCACRDGARCHRTLLMRNLLKK